MHIIHSYNISTSKYIRSLEARRGPTGWEGQMSFVQYCKLFLHELPYTAPKVRALTHVFLYHLLEKLLSRLLYLHQLHQLLEQNPDGKSAKISGNE